jgi:hypothetical protein
VCKTTVNFVDIALVLAVGGFSVFSMRGRGVAVVAMVITGVVIWAALAGALDYSDHWE